MCFEIKVTALSSRPQWSLQWRHNGWDGISNRQRLDCLLNCLFRLGSKKTSKFHVTGLCVGKSSVTREFPSQRVSNAENVSIWWRHHVSGRLYDCWSLGKKQIPKHKNIIFYKNCKQLLNMGRGLFEHVIYWSTSAAIGHERLDGYACNIADIELNWKPLTYALNNECIFNFNYIKYSSWKVRVQWTDRGPVTHICVI